MGKVFAYARVSTAAQELDPQTDELRKDGFDVLVVDKASGASRTRSELAMLVREMKAGDILKVVCINRLARPISHLLEVIETLEGKGAHFRSLRDPIDTTTPQGMFSLQVLVQLPSWSGPNGRLVQGGPSFGENAGQGKGTRWCRNLLNT
jgi:DNA invertase Pin-like site-specific DNA recombinase